MKYVDNTQDCDENGYSQYPGLLKNRSWKDNAGKVHEWIKEEETRIRVAVRPRGLEVETQDTRKYLQAVKI